MPIQLIDTHAHLYVKQFDEDRSAMVERALGAGVTSLYLPNIDVESIDPMHAMADQFPEIAFPMMGLHPCSVKEDFKDVLAGMRAQFDERSYVGVGETGIDLYWDTSTEAWQREAFAMQIDWAIELELPIVIHSRSALDITIEMIAERKCEALNGIFHCFDGTVEQARAIMETGFYLGIGGSTTYKKSKTVDVLREVGLSHVVLETDAPYLSPTPKRGKRNESAYLVHTATFVADGLELPLSTVAQATTGNAARIFGQAKKKMA